MWTVTRMIQQRLLDLITVCTGRTKAEFRLALEMADLLPGWGFAHVCCVHKPHKRIICWCDGRPCKSPDFIWRIVRTSLPPLLGRGRPWLSVLYWAATLSKAQLQRKLWAAACSGHQSLRSTSLPSSRPTLVSKH